MSSSLSLQALLTGAGARVLLHHRAHVLHELNGGASVLNLRRGVGLGLRGPRLPRELPQRLDRAPEWSSGRGALRLHSQLLRRIACSRSSNDMREATASGRSTITRGSDSSSVSDTARG